MDWIQNERADSYRLDLLECIDDAIMGQLPPSRQEYCFEVIENLRGTEDYPEDGNLLFQKLRDALAHTPQISELENEIQEVNAIGGELLFFYYLDRYTVLELVKHSDGSGFDSFVFICEEKHRDTIQEIAAEMQEALEEWLKHCVYPHGDISARNQLNQKDFCRYGTLDDALTFLFTALKYPDNILT